MSKQIHGASFWSLLLSPGAAALQDITGYYGMFSILRHVQYIAA